MLMKMETTHGTLQKLQERILSAALGLGETIGQIMPVRILTEMGWVIL